MNLTLIILVAPSASGKSTYAAKLLDKFKANGELASVLCPDALREELTGNINDQSRNGFIFNQLVPIRINGAWARREHVVFDATSVSKKARKSIIGYARANGYEVEAHVFRVPIEVCKARNAARERRVPDSVIDRQFAQFQEPELSEGIDRIVEVPNAN